MVMAAGKQKRRLAPVALCQLEAEHVAIKRNRPLKVSHLQMDMPYPDIRCSAFDSFFIASTSRRAGPVAKWLVARF